ncbi:MAG: sulfatase [Planctomycetes bacterium]|nr:sulfatase [Planctomycetota bacterium]
MSRLHHLACLVIATLVGCAAPPTRQRAHPNLVILLADQWRGQALGFLGRERVRTPNLDDLARQSLVLTEAVSNYPVCSPFRAMLMSGQYPFSNRVLGNCNSDTSPHGCELQRTTRCWSDVLHDHGYALGYIGKWHLESPRPPFVESANNGPKMAWNEWTPPDRRHGFDFWHAYNTFDQHLAPEYWETAMGRDDRLKVKQWGPEHEADVAIEFLDAHTNARQPFALVVSMNPPHMPYQQVPQRYLDDYRDIPADELIGDRPDLLPAQSRWGRYTRLNMRLQYAMMTGVDEQIGRILAALAARGLADDTIVVFASDHGDCLGLHGQISKNNHYELSMRIPLIVRWPGVIPARHDDLRISVPDLYPTLLDLLGLEGEVPAAVEGVSHAALFRTGIGPRPDDQLYLKVPTEAPAGGLRGLRTERYTLVIERHEDGTESTILRDRLADPYQMENVADLHPDVVATLRSRMEPQLRRLGDPWVTSGAGDAGR